MKALYLVPLLGLLACAGKPSAAAKSPAHASVGDCNQVYRHILTLKEDEITTDENRHYTAEQHQWGVHLLDQEYLNNGTTGAFFQFCLAKMTPDQIRCSLRSDTLVGINACRL